MDYQLSKIKSISIERIAKELGMDVRRHTALCPFHDDHHPSLHFHAKTNTFRCFACDSRGSNIDLVMKLRECSFTDAYRWIAERNGIALHHTLNGLPATASRRPSAQVRIQTEKSSVLTLHPSLHPQADGSLPLGGDGGGSSLVSRFASSESPFCRALTSCGILTEEQMRHAAELYRLGRTKEDGVVFWQIDEHDRLREGKVMWYEADCHRSHVRKPVSASWLLKRKGLLNKKWTAARCLFGQHLLATAATSSDIENCHTSSDTRNKVLIAIVESEKTAVICSELLPSLTCDGLTMRCLWLATGGLSCLNVSLVRPLAAYRVVIFPDTDTDGSAFNHWSAVAAEASQQLGSRFFVSDILERQASEEQKQRKIDIADFIIQNS